MVWSVLFLITFLLSRGLCDMNWAYQIFGMQDIPGLVCGMEFMQYCNDWRSSFRLFAEILSGTQGRVCTHTRLLLQRKKMKKNESGSLHNEIAR